MNSRGYKIQIDPSEKLSSKGLALLGIIHAHLDISTSTWALAQQWHQNCKKIIFASQDFL